MAQVLGKYNQKGKHGVTSHLTESQVSDLVEFLKALPFEQPEALAKKAGLRKIER